MGGWGGGGYIILWKDWVGEGKRTGKESFIILLNTYILRSKCIKGTPSLIMLLPGRPKNLLCKEESLLN